MEAKCFNCERAKPFLFGGFIKCNHCGRIFCPECSNMFESIVWYTRKHLHTRCPQCKNIGFSKML